MKRILVTIGLLFVVMPCFAQDDNPYTRRGIYPPSGQMNYRDWWIYEQSFGGADGYADQSESTVDGIIEKNKGGVISTFKYQAEQNKNRDKDKAKDKGASGYGYIDPTVYTGP